jgi:hypothetical protein
VDKIKQRVIESFKAEFGYVPEDQFKNIKIDLDYGIAEADKYWCRLTKTGKVKKHSWRLNLS